MHCNNLRLVLGLGLLRVSSWLRVRIRVKVRVSVMVRVSSRTSWVVNFALFRCYRPVIYTRPVSFGHDSYTYRKSRSLGSWVKHVEPDRRKEPIPLTSSLTLSVKLHLSCQKLTASLKSTAWKQTKPENEWKELKHKDYAPKMSLLQNLEAEPVTWKASSVEYR